MTTNRKTKGELMLEIAREAYAQANTKETDEIDMIVDEDELSHRVVERSLQIMYDRQGQAYSGRERKLALKEKRRLEKQLKNIDRITEAVTIALKEGEVTNLQARQSVLRRLNEAERALRNARRYGQVSAEVEARYQSLTNEYIDYVLQRLAINNAAVLNDLQRLGKQLGPGRLLPQRTLDQ